MTVEVLNLATGERRIYSGISPAMAVVAADQQSKGNYSTWTYDQFTAQEGRVSVSSGDWAALK